MGAWDVGTFDNDAARDWAYELESQSDISMVALTLVNVLAVGAEYLDSYIASEGLAAAEVVARLRGNWGVRNSSTETIDTWVETHPTQPSTELVSQAIAAIDRVLTEPSELLELWSDSDDFVRWRNAIEDLRRRVAT
jgi:hypothetical protein